MPDVAFDEIVVQAFGGSGRMFVIAIDNQSKVLRP
jgi:hypothetical protein